MPVSAMKFKVYGAKQIDRALESLIEPKFRKAALRRAGRDLMKPVLVDAKRLAPVLTVNDKTPAGAVPGELRDDIKLSSSVNVDPRINKAGTRVTSSSAHELKIVVKTGKASEDYALVTEYGRERFTVIRNTAFGKATKPYFVEVASLTPQPFMRPALDNNVTYIVKTFTDVMWQEIKTQLKKQRRAQMKKPK